MIREVLYYCEFQHIEIILEKTTEEIEQQKTKVSLHYFKLDNVGSLLFSNGDTKE